MILDPWKIATIALGLSTTGLIGHAFHEPTSGTAIVTADSPAPRRALREQIQQAVQLSENDEEALLEELRETDNTARAVALLEQLAFIGTPRSVPHVLSMMDDPRLPVARAAVETIGRLGSAPAVEALVEMVESGNRRLRLDALFALSDVDSDRAASRLSAYARDRSSPIRINAIEALGKSMRTSAEAVLAQLTEDPSPRIATVAVEALANMGSESADRLIRRLSTQGHGPVRVAALANLPNTSDDEVFNALRERLISRQPNEVSAVVAALIRSRRPEVVAVLGQCA